MNTRLRWRKNAAFDSRVVLIVSLYVHATPSQVLCVGIKPKTFLIPLPYHLQESIAMFFRKSQKVLSSTLQSLHFLSLFSSLNNDDEDEEDDDERKYVCAPFSPHLQQQQQQRREGTKEIID